MLRPLRGRARAFFLLACLLAALLSLAGCGKRGGDRVRVYPARGRVVFAGQPASGALVLLHPVDGQQSLPFSPRARVNNDGSFALTTFDNHDGAPAGEYAVSIDWRRRNPNDETDEGVSLIPARYNRPDTSGIRVRIEPLNGPGNELPEIQLQK